MTVKELKDMIQTCPDDMEIYIYYHKTFGVPNVDGMTTTVEERQELCNQCMKVNDNRLIIYAD